MPLDLSACITGLYVDGYCRRWLRYDQLPPAGLSDADRAWAAERAAAAPGDLRAAAAIFAGHTRRSRSHPIAPPPPSSAADAGNPRPESQPLWARWTAAAPARYSGRPTRTEDAACQIPPSPAGRSAPPGPGSRSSCSRWSRPAVPRSRSPVGAASSHGCGCPTDRASSATSASGTTTWPATSGTARTSAP